ncbi:TraI protein [Xanthomonas citri pv. aurantifolii str. ICPB 11122]|nr:TraI protein [Xanthomonas citri pv. aurantifolii str. ICPB 11122]
MNQAVALIKQASAVSEGYRTVALAPYGNQVKALKNEGLEAHTLASFLRTKDKPIDGKTIIVLDESGVVGARQMEQVMRVVEKAGARMVLLGDTKQTEAIEAGKPFAQLQQEGMQGIL